MKSFVHLFASMLALTSLQAQTRATDTAAQPTQRLAFSQHCFWTGEMKLGEIDGVIRTEAGFIEGHEVTLVDYDPGRVSLEALVTRAKQAGVADRIHLPVGSASVSSIAGVSIGAPLDRSYRAASANDQKKQLEGTPYTRFKLTPEQATKVNAFVRVDPARAREWLTAPQRETLTSTH
ncbi:MAG: hypothetical protein ABI217_07990 [Chthoniobacterales bacterium]